MRGVKLNFENHLDRFRTLVGVALLLMAGVFAQAGFAQGERPKTFSTPEEAAQALYTAARNNDEEVLLEIFGASGRQILHSGDAREDAESRTTFLKEYEEMHRLVQEPDRTVTLYIGANNWPAPVPIVNKAGSWFFDTSRGMQEILFRRIGRNEISAIQVCRALAAAQKEYFQEHHAYAQKIFSDEGKQDGLYWEASEHQPESPVGPLVAHAVADGYDVRRESAIPYWGYFFRILTSQGRHDPGGAKSYVTEGKMTGGFAFVAYPAEYRSSGVKTFLVGTDGVVYEKDLGKNTAAIASSMKQFNPDPTWHETEDEQGLQ